MALPAGQADQIADRLTVRGRRLRHGSAICRAAVRAGRAACAAPAGESVYFPSAFPETVPR